MAFKTGKGNVYTKMKEQVAQLEEQLRFEREKPMLQAFAQRLGHALLVQLATQPYSDWPQFAKDTFAWVANDSPTAAWAYKERLPKK